MGYDQLEKKIGLLEHRFIGTNLTYFHVTIVKNNDLFSLIKFKSLMILCHGHLLFDCKLINKLPILKSLVNSTTKNNLKFNK